MIDLPGDSPDIAVGDLLRDAYGTQYICTGLGDRPVVVPLPAGGGEAWLPLQTTGLRFQFAEPAVAEPTVAEPAVAEPTVAEPAVAEPAAKGK